MGLAHSASDADVARAGTGRTLPKAQNAVDENPEPEARTRLPPEVGPTGGCTEDADAGSVTETNAPESEPHGRPPQTTAPNRPSSTAANAA